MKMIIVLWLFSLSAMANIGEVVKIIGSNAKIKRGDNMELVSEKMTVREGDIIQTNDSIVQLILYPGTQFNIAQQSEVAITQHMVNNESKKSKSLIDIIKGELRVLVKKITDDEELDQTYRVQDVGFGVRGTEFTIYNGPTLEVEVFEGEIESMDLTKNLKISTIRSRQRFEFKKSPDDVMRPQLRPFSDRPRRIDFRDVVSGLNSRRKQQGPRVRPSKGFLNGKLRGQ